MTGTKFLREYPYREAYLLRDAKLFRAELSMPLILLGGITNRQTMDLAMAEGFDFVAMGRALLAEHAVVLHPGPMLRGMEIAYSVADSPQSAVLQQVSNGVHVRMAVLFHLLVGAEEGAISA